MNIGSVPTVSSPFRKGHRLLVWRLRASGYALRPSSPHQQPILILIVAAFSSCLSPRILSAAQLETVIYAGEAWSRDLHGRFTHPVTEVALKEDPDG